MLADIHLQNFRSYTDESFEFSPGVNIIVGPNASGKTNLLEAILVLAKGKSYRAKDNELVKFNKPWARLDAHLTNSSLRTLKLTPNAVPTKAYELDGKKYKTLNISQALPIVLFEPSHLDLLTGSPENRRDYLDDLLEQTVLGYERLRRQYKRALAQRNSLLKQPSNNFKTEAFPWDIRLSELAGQIARARYELVSQIDNNISELYKQLSKSKTKVGLSYQSRWPVESYESQMLKELYSCLDMDRMRGFTSPGPHREDLNMSFNGHPAHETASRGELRTAVLSLKVKELQLIEKMRDQKPILLLDDVFSELDGKRRHALTDYLMSYQTFITTTDADAVVEHFTNDYNTIPVSN